MTPIGAVAISRKGAASITPNMSRTPYVRRSHSPFGFASGEGTDAAWGVAGSRGVFAVSPAVPVRPSGDTAGSTVAGASPVPFAGVGFAGVPFAGTSTLCLMASTIPGAYPIVDAMYVSATARTWTWFRRSRPTLCARRAPRRRRCRSSGAQAGTSSRRRIRRIRGRRRGRPRHHAAPPSRLPCSIATTQAGCRSSDGTSRRRRTSATANIRFRAVPCTRRTASPPPLGLRTLPGRSAVRCSAQSCRTWSPRIATRA